MRIFYLLLLCCITLFRANSQPGSLDSTFGNNGIQTTAFVSDGNSLSEQGRVVLTSANGAIFLVIRIESTSYTRIAKYLPDGRLDSSYGIAGYSDAANLNSTSAVMQGGKIVVAGSTYAHGGGDFALARYTADGALDSSFGVNGRVTTDINNSDDVANSIAIQGNKIVVAGTTIHYFPTRTDFALVRYTVDGMLDSSFGVIGRVITDINNSNDEASSIALQGDKIIVAGYSNADIALARYTTDGKLDSTFGVNGRVTTDFDINDRATSIVLQGDKIIVGGYTYHSINPDYDFVLARYTADGALDSSFGVNGKVTTDFRNNSADRAYSIALQGDKIIAAGYTTNNVNNTFDFALARYTADGKLDASFGKHGKVTTGINNSDDIAYSIAIQGDKILLAGDNLSYINGKVDFDLLRYTTDGVLDSSFGTNGIITGHFPSSQASYTSTVIQGNKIIAVGYAANDNDNNDFALVRYTANGALDASFGEHGKETTDFNNSRDEIKSIALQGDKIVAAGVSFKDYKTPYTNFALARYTADGKLDSTFGLNGKVTTDFNNSFDEARAIAIQGDKILVAGTSSNNFALARYTSDGTLDSTFGVNGVVTTNFRSNDDVATSIALQGDKIILAGTTHNSGTGTAIALARYTADGKLDRSFGVNGKVISDFGKNDEIASSIALQGDKIVVGGFTYNPDTYNDFTLVRYTSDGMLDSSFGVNGKVTTDFNGSVDYAWSIALQGDKIIAVGDADIPTQFKSNFALARYTVDGALDSSFGVNGKVTTDVEGSGRLQAIALHENRLYAVGSISALAIGTVGAIAAYQLETPGPAVPSITIADVTVSESKRFAVVSAHLSVPTNKLVRVHFTTRDKTALHNVDYVGVSGPLFFIPGVNTTFKLPIPIIDDNIQEGKEQFEVVSTKAWNATIQDSVAVVTIMDDDNAPIAKLESTSLHIIASPNPSSDAFTVQLLGSNLKQRASVRVYDMSGRLVEQRNNTSIGQSLHLGDQYKAGTYIIEAVQGTQKVQKEVIKMGK